eukprot:TRINITY_DN7853_c0_g1_i1.p1 TRINITY_DN7853_c0_g1~~TRINITY_DN7853_c0_g1_i1.p1  ORF type:complete len:229 (+),score=80.91 TRINITY_DN7853_c0_g1_i1:79-765(+)
MGTYLENYLEGVSSLPQEVRRGFALLRDLDTRSQDLIDKIEDNSKTFIKGLKRKKENVEEEKLIRDDIRQCLELADEKIALAVQTYELVDKHIRKLDSDLKKFEAELQLDQANKDLKTTASGSLSSKNGNGKAKKSEKENKSHRKKVPQDGLPVDPKALSVEIDMPIDPNEPTYCICGQVSFGEMVGCDNADCKIEWFHYSCVGLTSSPKGKWYCPDCSVNMKKKLKA